MRIVLVNPISQSGQGYHTIGSRIPQLGLQVLARCTPAPHQVDIYDEIFGSDNTIDDIASGRYDLVGITAMTSGAARAYQIARACRERGMTVIFGGIHATTCPDEAAEYFDSVVIGEADELWPQILRDFEQGNLKPRYQTDKFPELHEGHGEARQTVEPVNGRYDVASIQTSRGCPTGCKFCSVTRVNGARIRRRTIDSILDEWNAITKSFVFVVDDNFFGLSSKQAEWTKQLLREIIKRGKKRLWFSQTTINMGDDAEALRLAYKAGCRAMLVGLESFDEQNLLEYQKRLASRSLGRYKELIGKFHKAGIAVFGAVIVGADNDVPESIRNAACTAIDLGVDILQITNLTPLPGTDLYDEFKQEGRLIAADYPNDWDKYTFIHTVFEPKRMTARQLDEAMFLFRRAAAECPWVLKRTIKSLFRTRSLTTALFVHGMNRGFLRMAKRQVQFDALALPHLTKVPVTPLPS